MEYRLLPVLLLIGLVLFLLYRWLFGHLQLAYVLGKMQSIKEDEGTLLDNTMLVYGAGISDGDRHNHDDLPILLEGKR